MAVFLEVGISLNLLNILESIITNPWFIIKHERNHMKLKKGDSINELTLPSVDGSTFNLETIKGKKAMISFYRYSSCPFCLLYTSPSPRD